MRAPILRAVAVALVAAVLFPTWRPPIAQAAALTGPGSAVVVTGEGSSAHRNSGGSATPFSVALPHGATCPGDSADGGYRVQSFIVPATIDPATLIYTSIFPQGYHLYSLFDTYTRSFAQEQTAKADVKGGPGQIVNIPTFDFKVIPPGSLQSGRYHIGIACTLLTKTVRYWSVDIILTQSRADQPAGFTWRVADPPPEKHLSLLGGISIGVVIVAVVLGAVLVLRRRRLAPGSR